MVEAKLGLFQMQQKGVLGHALELVEAGFGEAPEGLDAVAVRGPLDELVLAVADAEVAVEAHVDQPVVPAPTVGIDHGRDVNFATNNGLQRLFGAIRDDFGIDLPAAFEQAEDDGFAARAPAPFAAYAPRAEVAFVEFNGPGQLGWHQVPRQEPVAQPQVERIDGAGAQPREAGRIRSRQIQGKEPQQVAKFDLRKFAALIVAVSRLHNNKLRPDFRFLLPKPQH